MSAPTLAQEVAKLKNELEEARRGQASAKSELEKMRAKLEPSGGAGGGGGGGGGGGAKSTNFIPGEVLVGGCYLLILKKSFTDSLYLQKFFSSPAHV